MARSDAVWGIDLGQCALKALRCRPHEKDDNRIVVEAFDYIEYEKILTQPEADREALVRDALTTFLSRNEVVGDRVAISVPGQSGLARFIKLPPVEAKKIPDIVKYEARQQIPFALEDVVWDYQALAGGSVDEGYALETEVGIFAMKRDQVTRHLKPFEEAGIEVETIQLGPLSIYNFVCFDQLGNLETYQRDNPPPSKIVLSLGTDTTDLVITDGFRVWQRSIPIGGNHFTKALTKELKLTFAKAEHLKRNAMKAENPKAVFQAMRPTFSDLVAEIQRSIGFFTSNNRNAKLGDVIALGNPMKLPGLQRFLSQNLDQPVTPIENFNALVGGSVTAVPQFKENQLTFGVAYGLCVQALGKSQIQTNLLPVEIITKRLVRGKKPWAVAAAAVLLCGLAVNYYSYFSAWRSAAVEPQYNDQMSKAIAKSKSTADNATALDGTHTTLVDTFKSTVETGNKLVSNVEGRLLWLEMLKAMESALPKDERDPTKKQETAEDVTSRRELHIESMDCEYMADVTPWFTSIKPLWDESKQPLAARKAAEAAAAAAAAAAAPPVDGATPDAATAEAPPVEPATPPPAATPPAADAAAAGGEVAASEGAGPSGPGWIIQLKGYHYHNVFPGKPDLVPSNDEEKQFIENSFFKQLEEGTVELPDGPGGELVAVPISKLGITYPVVTTRNRIITRPFFPESSGDEAGGGMNRFVAPERGPAGLGVAAGDAAVVEPKKWNLRRYDFTIQFLWKKTPRSERNKPKAEEGQLQDTAAVDAAGTPAG